MFLGMGAVLALLLGSGLGLAALVFALGLDTGGLLFRYTALIVSQGVLVLVPFGIVALFRAPWSSLGLAPLPPRGLVESALIGGALVGVTGLYSIALQWAAPSAYQKLLEEQANQMKLLEAPLPLLILAAVVLAPLAEEVFFRGFVFGGLRRSLGFGGAALFSSALFAVLHMMWVSSPPLFLVGLGAAIQYGRYRSLAAPLALHIAFNAVALTLELV